MARKNAVPAKVPTPDAYPKVLEHFGDPSWAIRDLRNAGGPSINNGIVRVDRYQVRVEKIDEPDDVIIARLKKLWRESEKNHHRWDPVRSFVMRRFGWTHGKASAEFPVDEQGADYVEKRR